jgi:hypothetical protein
VDASGVLLGFLDWLSMLTTLSIWPPKFVVLAVQ